MDPTALYYTFSTIAQALAGALAVLVAFVLFKLSDLDLRSSWPSTSYKGSTRTSRGCGRS